MSARVFVYAMERRYVEHAGAQSVKDKERSRNSRGVLLGAKGIKMLDRVFVFTCCLLIGICLGNVAFANQTFVDNQDGLYIGFALAPQRFADNVAGDVTIDFDTGVAFSGLIGYRLSSLRLEGEFARQTVEGTSKTNVNADIDIVRFTGAAYYDFDLFKLKPYLGGGMGVANLDATGDFDDDDSGFTWHSEVGLTLNVTDRFAILPAYRYEWTDTDLGTFNEAQGAHAFRVSLRYRFRPAPQRVREPDSYYRHKPRPRYPHDLHHECGSLYNPDCHYRPRPNKPEAIKTPEKRERDRCGWQGPGCP